MAISKAQTQPPHAEGPRGTPRSGFTLIELMVVTVVVAILASIVMGGLRSVMLKAQIASVVADGKLLYNGFQEFYAENYNFPNATSNPAFDLVTFEPMTSMGYNTGNMQERLEGDQASAYDSPDDQGTNQEFWVTMNLKIDPTYTIVVASSDNVPVNPGTWYEGVFVFKDGVQVQGPGG